VSRYKERRNPKRQRYASFKILELKTGKRIETRACLQSTEERIGIGRGTLCISDARGIPESANV
jgi:hypothetical protein